MEGLKTVRSDFDPDETVARLEKEIVAQGMKVFSRIHHSALAAEAGLALSPTELVIFGNPRAGTPLMQASQTIGIDLPLKALIWRDAFGATWFSYNDPVWLAKRHELKGMDPVAAGMGLALDAIALKVTRTGAAGSGGRA